MLGSKQFLRSLFWLSCPLLVVSFAMRIYVLTERLTAGDSFEFTRIARAMAGGLCFDFVTLIYFFTPLAVIYLLSPPALLRSKGFYRWFLPLGGFLVFLWILISCCEVTFYREFQSRFNFIAVDYLVYTNTVLENIWESYPILQILAALAAVVLVLMVIFKKIIQLKFEQTRVLVPKAKFLALWAACFCGALFFISEDRWLSEKSLLQNEVEKNAIHTLFAAYLNNEIEFTRFYPTLDSQQALVNTQRLLDEPSSNKVPSQEQKLNVMVITMESMSARFLQAYGDTHDLTPNLNRLAKAGLFFNRVYATGTRTVRGLEAITLSVPPTPGQSILRRPNNESLFNISSVFRQNGYRTQFLYGGYAWFDNMRYFFANNGFEVLDETNLNDHEITFSNAWGACDEDLFNMAIREADQIFAQHKPFFQLVMTTSNHRPYSYPEGKVDIPSKTHRFGAVKYSDYAIGQLLKEAQKKPWFQNTVFVFIADHNAAVAGNTEIPIDDYLIPMIFYSPKHIPIKTVTTLGSQIDFAPTLFSLLGLAVPPNRLFGHDLLHTNIERAFLATYQDVAYLKGGKMVVFMPKKIVETIDLDQKLRPHSKTKRHWDAKLFENSLYLEAISFYQGAAERFKNGSMKEK